MRTHIVDAGKALTHQVCVDCAQSQKVVAALVRAILCYEDGLLCWLNHLFVRTVNHPQCKAMRRDFRLAAMVSGSHLKHFAQTS